MSANGQHLHYQKALRGHQIDAMPRATVFKKKVICDRGFLSVYLSALTRWMSWIDFFVEDPMMTRLLMLSLSVLLLFTFAYGQNNKPAGPHVPAAGSAERQAILDALRADQDVKFKVHYIKVHDGWCWVDTTPLDKDGHPTAEGGPNLLHLENGKWKVMDLSTVPDDPKDPLGAEDASPGFIKNLMKTFPGVPRDIFPKPKK